MGVVEEKADLLDLLLEATNDGVVDWDPRGRETHYNDRWRFLLGFDEAGFELSPDTWRELIHADDRTEVEKAVADHLEQQWPFVQTARMRHRSMGWRWILLRGTARRDARGDAVRMVILFSDVDERVRAEAQVRALIEAIPDTLVRVRSDGTLLAVKEGNRLVNVNPDDDRQPGTFDAILASDAGENLKARIRGVAENESPAQIQCRVRNRDEEPIECDVRIVRSGADEAVCIVRDVTREKRAEEQLARGRKLESIGRLAAGLAHEINTPLQYIGDNLQFAKDAIPDLLGLIDSCHELLAAGPAQASRALDVLGKKEEEIDLPFLRESLVSALGNGLDGLEQIGRIVRAMRMFEDAAARERARVELNTIVENATVVSSYAWSKVAEVSLHLADQLPFVPCVAGEIAQVIVNLVSNAAQAIADKVGRSGPKGRITVETAHLPAIDSVEIRVTDDGVGIPEANRGKIFDPFFTTRTVGQGRGQGLVQVHSVVVNLHGGSVRFETETGKGTTFFIRLPIDGKPTITPSPDEARSRSVGTSPGASP